MKPVAIPVCSLMIVLCVLAMGCTSGTGPAAPSPENTAAPATTAIPATAVPAATVTDAGNGPLQTLPQAQQVTFDLTRDRPASEIHLLYQGGAGDIFTQAITLRVYNADGTSADYMMNDGQKPIPGNEVVVPGTHNGDRCMVLVTSAGVTYKVMDEKVYSSM